MSNETEAGLPGEELAEISYNSINPWSLVALVFGMLSLLTIASLGFLFVVFLGIVIGTWAMRVCLNRRQTGYQMARIAIFLSVVGAVFGIGYNYGRIGWLAHIAYGHGQTVIAAIQDDRLEEAFTYALEPAGRPPNGTDLFEFFKSRELPRGESFPPVVTLNLWMGFHPVAPMVADRLNGKFEYVGYESQTKYPDREEIVLRYRYIPQSPDIDPYDFVINYHRRVYPDPVGTHWRARLFGIVDKTGTPERHVLTNMSASPRKRIKSGPADKSSSGSSDQESPPEPNDQESSSESK